MIKLGDLSVDSSHNCRGIDNHWRWLYDEFPGVRGPQMPSTGQICCHKLQCACASVVHSHIVLSLTHTHSFNGPLSRTTRVSRYQKGKTNLDVTESRDSGVSWDICTSAPCSRQITTPALHHSVFYRPDALPATQPTASKH